MKENKFLWYMIQKNNCGNVTGGFRELLMSPQSLDTASTIRY
jgi:hypothetical protein